MSRCRCWKQLGYRTIEAETASAALDVLANGKSVRLVFSDVVLPGQIDGLALARTVSERYPHIPVVLTTGYTKVFEADPEFPLLRKPYQISALGRVIHDALDPSMPTFGAGGLIGRVCRPSLPSLGGHRFALVGAKSFEAPRAKNGGRSRARTYDPLIKS